MQLHSVCCSDRLLQPSLISSSSPSSPSSATLFQRLLTPFRSTTALSLGSLKWKGNRFRSGYTSKGHLTPVGFAFSKLNGSGRVKSYLPDSENPLRMKDAAASIPDSSHGPMTGSPDSIMVRGSGALGWSGLEPFRGKSGSVSFYGLTHQMLEERKLVSSPFKDDTGSLLWVLGPLALVSSVVVPQLYLGHAIQAIFKDEILAEIVASFSSEVIFYVGLAAFLSITDRVQRPYLDFSAKRWSLITGLRGYLSSAFLTMGLKVFAPLLAAYVFWPAIGLPGLVAVVPFLLGCAAQFAFEVHLGKRGSSCWPLLPIIFEVYRLCQLNKGAHFIGGLLFEMRGASPTLAMVERGRALISMLVVLQILGVVCLWSLATFLLRLFPSRPVAENY